MDILFNFLTTTILFFKNIFKKHDYKIIDRSMEYWVDEGEWVTSDNFWERQSELWDGYTETYYVRLKPGEFVPPPPKNVSKILMRVKYWYNNRIFKYITYDHDYAWPPVKNKGIHFSMPLLSAQLLDYDGESVSDILSKVKRYSGPHCDFYGMKVKISDMFYYENGRYPKIRIKNLLGFSKTVSTTDGYISDLRVP
jgi:hypothetical protein